VTPREGLPSFKTTSLAKVLVGEQPCYLSPWIQGHFKIQKATRDCSGLALWKANHTAALNTVVERFKAEGWKCSVERYFRVTGQTAILTGKTDLIAQRPDNRPRIVDVKSGQPRESDVAQVMIEQTAIPLSWQSPHMIFSGEVIYADHTVSIPAAHADELKPKLFLLLKRLATPQRPDAVPSESNCRFCDVSKADCPERYEGTEDLSAETSLF